MDHAITWDSLFGAGFIVGGLALIGVGLIALFAGGMSDAPEAGDDAGRTGCILGIGGIVLLSVGIWLVR